MKKILLTIPLFLIYTYCSAQANFHKLSLGAGAGATISYADVAEHTQSYATYGTADFNITPFIQIGLEGQIGKIKGGNLFTNTYNREFINEYKSLTINTKVGLGELMDFRTNEFLNAIKGLYAGVGIGVISNSMAYIVRYKPNTEIEYPPLGYRYPGKDFSKNLALPINLGINFFFRNQRDVPRLALNINYQTNFTFGEGLDGYNDPPGITLGNDFPDVYSFISVGLKYNFGPVGFGKRIFN